MLYNAMAYGHLEAEVSVARDSPVVDGSNCSILHVGIPSRHCRVHDRDRENRSVRVSEDDYSVKPVLVRVEALQVEFAPVLHDSGTLHSHELFVHLDLANSNVHGWALILCLPSVMSCFDVAELRYSLSQPCQFPNSICRRTSSQCRRGGIEPW